MAEGGRLQYPRHGLSVAVPEQPPWEPAPLRGAVAAFQAPGSARMSLQSRCGRPVAAPPIMARHLVIGLPERTLRQAGPVTVGDWPGWSQTFDTLSDGAVVRVKTVTLVAEGCAFDWILTARSDFEAAEPSFDAWWQSFEFDAAAAAEAEKEARK
ncbi:MAG TPA: hypothetical protein VIY27_11605 [Myxococcota bacterium]